MTYDEVKQQEQAFRARHPDWKHSMVPRYRQQVDRINEVWGKLLQRQNGRDLDLVVVDGEHKAVRLLREHAGPGDKVLAIGVGAGQEVQCIADAGWPCTGVTLGPMNIEFAREEYQGLNLHYMDAHHLPMWPAGTFDVVVALQTLEHSWAPLMLLIEFCRLLKHGGKVILETPAPAVWSMGNDLHHTLCPTRWQMVNLLWKAGFPRVIEGGVPFSHSEWGNQRAGPLCMHNAGDNVVAVGTKWRLEEAGEVEPTIRELTR